MMKISKSGALGLVLAMGLAYANAPGSEFVFDSATVIQQDVRLRMGAGEAAKAIFTQDYWSPRILGLFRPLTTLSFWVDYHVWGNGENPLGYHLTNLLLHGAVALLLWCLLRLLGMGREPAWWGAALFAVHPLGTEAVTNLVGRSDLLAALFILGGTCVYARVRQSGEWGWRWGMVLACCSLGAFLSKEHGVVLLGAVWLYDQCYEEGGRDWKGRLRAGLQGRYLWVLLPLLLVGCYRWWLYRDVPMGGVSFMDNPLVDSSLPDRWVTAGRVIALYVGKFLCPVHLSPDYSFNEIPVLHWPYVSWEGLAGMGALAAGLGVGGWLWVRRRGHPRPAFLFFLAAGALLPYANLIKPVASMAGERFLYLPLAGATALAVLAVEQGVRWLAARTGVQGRVWRPASVFLVMAGAGLMVRTHLRNRDWEDNVALFRSAVEAAPRSVRNHSAYAAALYHAGMKTGVIPWEQIIGQEEAAWAIMRTASEDKWSQKVPLDLAAFYCQRAVQQDGFREDMARAEQLAAGVFEKWREYGERHILLPVEMAGRKAVPDTFVPLRALDLAAEAAERSGERERAADYLEKGIGINPSDAGRYRKLGGLWMQQNCGAKAAPALLKGIVLGTPETRTEDWPRLREAFANMGMKEDAVMEAGGQTGLNLQVPAVAGLLREACRDIHQALVRAGRKADADSFARAAKAQFGVDLEALRD